MSTVVETPAPTELDLPLTTREHVLARAADLVEMHGYKRGDLGNETTGFCILGAVEAAAREFGLASHYHPSVPFYGYTSGAQLLGAADTWDVWLWNDHLRRRLFRPSPKDRVAARLRRLAAGATWAESA